MSKSNLSMEYRFQSLGKPLRHAVVVSLCAAALSGCAGSVNMANFGVPKRNHWTVLEKSRPPEGPLEEAVVQAALEKTNVTAENSDCFFIYDSKSAQFVDIVERSPNTNRMALKNVTRYRIADGRISALTDAAAEVYPDVEFERAVLRCAAKVMTPDQVLLYDDEIHPVTMASRLTGNCVAEVRIWEGNQEGGKPFAKKLVNFCVGNPDGGS